MDHETLKSLSESRYPSIIVDGRGSIDVAVEGAVQVAELMAVKNRIEFIKPENDKKSISIDQARSLRKKVTLKSQSSTYRVFIIKDISLMGSEAQNTLLKTLEELGDNISIIIAVARADEALPTIRSRSRIVVTKNLLNKRDNKKQFLIDSATVGYKYHTSLNETDLVNASEFMRYSVSDRLYHYKDMTENRENIITLLLSLRVLCISTMRETLKRESKVAWSQKVTTVNDLLKKADSSASGKLLLLGAATRL